MPSLYFLHDTISAFWVAYSVFKSQVEVFYESCGALRKLPYSMPDSHSDYLCHLDSGEAGDLRNICICVLFLTDVSVPRLPRYACQFIEMCLMVTADHGPAVSGAHNTIVCARAGKDLVSSLTSGLLTIVST